jgi:hypothetical protein
MLRFKNARDAWVGACLMETSPRILLFPVLGHGTRHPIRRGYLNGFQSVRFDLNSLFKLSQRHVAVTLGTEG